MSNNQLQQKCPYFPRVGTLLDVILPLVIFILLSSCDQPAQRRQYVEITTQPPEASRSMTDPHANIPGFKEMLAARESGENSLPNMGMLAGVVAPGPEVDLSWELPEGWQQKSGTGMRLATFTAGQAEEAIECSIVSLGGMAGGLEENIHRWMGQINLEVDDAQFQEFLKSMESFTTKGGFESTWIDLTTLQSPKAKNAPSIIAVVVTLGDKTIFIKMTGQYQALQMNREKFKKLCQSLTKTPT